MIEQVILIVEQGPALDKTTKEVNKYLDNGWKVINQILLPECNSNYPKIIFTLERNKY